MKTLVRLMSLAALMLFVLVTVIKIVQKCSYREAVGIAEQLWQEIADTFGGYCCGVGEPPDA